MEHPRFAGRGSSCADLAPIAKPALRACRLRVEEAIGILGIEAGAAAWTDGEDWLAEVLAYLEGNRQLLVDLVPLAALPGVHWTPPAATYLAWLDCSKLHLASPASFFLQSAKVALTAGGLFGSSRMAHSFGSILPHLTATPDPGYVSAHRQWPRRHSHQGESNMPAGRRQEITKDLQT